MGEVQRGRLLAAALEVLAEHGYQGMSVARVTARAGVSRRTFYDLFEDREDCFLGVFETALDRAGAVVRDAVEGRSGWRERLRAGLAALLVLFGEDPGLARLLVVDALGGGPRVLERRAQQLTTLREIVDRGRSQSRNGRASPPPLTAEGVIGGVLSVVHARLLERDPRPLVELLNPLMAMIVMPYLGQAAATKELSRPTPRARPAPRAHRDPLDDLEIRITYRTLRVLSVIASQPGSSNRQIANTAGISDQGQISKLLTRLQAHKLIENTGNGHTKGEPNAWTLTTKGQQIQHAVEAQAGR
jgi:AcrR family transcriptional regulator